MDLAFSVNGTAGSTAMGGTLNDLGGPATVVGGSFDQSVIEGDINSGSLYYNWPGISSATSDLSVYPLTQALSGNGTVTSAVFGSGVDLTLTLPVSYVFRIIDSDLGSGIVVVVDLTMTGNIVAKGSVVIPEPTSSLFLGGLMGGVGVVTRRRRL